jgi:hypothetical protein
MVRATPGIAQLTHLKEDQMSEGDPEHEAQREEQTREPAPDAPEEDVGVPPPPDDEEVREGVEKGSEEAFKSEEEED